MRYRGGGVGHPSPTRTAESADDEVDTDGGEAGNVDREDEDEDMDVPMITEEGVEAILASVRSGVGSEVEDDETPPVEEEDRSDSESESSSSEEDETLPGQDVIELEDSGRAPRVEGEDGYAAM